MKNISGFTIVELLIVIVVGGILSTVVFVAYSGIQESARGAKMVSAFDAVEKGLLAYAAEHGKYPEPTDILTPSNNTFICLQPTTSGWPTATGLTSSQCASPSSDPSEPAYTASPAVIEALKTKMSTIPDTSDLVTTINGNSIRGLMYVYMGGPNANYPQGVAYLMYHIPGNQTCGRGIGGADEFGGSIVTTCLQILN